jgi:hypothetical protein
LGDSLRVLCGYGLVKLSARSAACLGQDSSRFDNAVSFNFNGLDLGGCYRIGKIQAAKCNNGDGTNNRKIITGFCFFSFDFFRS